MALALNRAKVSHREIGIAYWGLDRVKKEWRSDGWMRAQVRYKLEVARGTELARERGTVPPAPGGEGG